MSSQSKSDAARANGAKSRGPITPEGKTRSSQNAIKHGLTATFKVLPGESEQDFENLLQSHRSHHQPATQLEEELVRSLVIARWRLARVAAIETHLFDTEMDCSKEQIDRDFTDIDDLDRLAFVFRKLADKSQSLSLLIRYENSLTRTCDRAFKHLLAVQKLRNEPKPEPQEPPPSSAEPIEIESPKTQIANDPAQSHPGDSPTTDPLPRFSRDRDGHEDVSPVRV